MLLADTPTLGLVIGLPILVLLTICCLVVMTAAWSQDELPIFFGTIIVGFIIWVIAILCYWPLKHDYHYYVDVNGKVQNISSRFIREDKGTSQRFVVVIDGQQYGIDDTRAALLHIGDNVSLGCKKEFNWGSSDGWACKWRD